MPKVKEFRRAEPGGLEHEVLRAAQQRLRQCPYAFVFCDVCFQYRDGRLILSGRVPSFYLKQVLQELLRGIANVQQIENDVDVVCSNGLSSVRNKPR